MVLQVSILQTNPDKRQKKHSKPIARSLSSETRSHIYNLFCSYTTLEKKESRKLSLRVQQSKEPIFLQEIRRHLENSLSEFAQICADSDIGTRFHEHSSKYVNNKNAKPKPSSKSAVTIHSMC